MNLKLHNRDEVFLVKLDSALYFKAEDHYTCVYYGRDTKQLLPFGLAHIEDALELCDADYMRFGRSHIINLQKVVHVSATKELVTLLTSDNTFLQIHIARTAIREIMAHLKDERPCEEGNIAGGGGILNNIEEDEEVPSHPITPITWNGELPFAAQATLKIHLISGVIEV